MNVGFWCGSMDSLRRTAEDRRTRERVGPRFKTHAQRQIPASLSSSLFVSRRADAPCNVLERAQRMVSERRLWVVWRGRWGSSCGSWPKRCGGVHSTAHARYVILAVFESLHLHFHSHDRSGRKAHPVAVCLAGADRTARPSHESQGRAALAGQNTLIPHSDYFKLLQYHVDACLDNPSCGRCLGACSACDDLGKSDPAVGLLGQARGSLSGFFGNCDLFPHTKRALRLQPLLRCLRDLCALRCQSGWAGESTPAWVVD